MEDHQIIGDNNNSRRQLQLFVKLLNGETLSLQFPGSQVQVGSVKHRIHDITKIPIHFQRLICGHQLNDGSIITDSKTTLNLSLRLLGGKGGFGSLLRGAATKAGQKKTSNFEACRDMSGRRLRHVNAEKRLEEWKAEEEDRRLEQIAEGFIKKKAKTGKKGAGDGEAEKYVKKYREESARCVAVVEESVKAALQNGKRKAVPGGADPKRLKIWMGKRKLNESDSGSDDSSEDEDDEENEKSVVLNNGNHSDYSKGTQDSSGSVAGGRLDGDISGGLSSESSSEEEKEIVLQESSKIGREDVCNEDNGTVEIKPEGHEEKTAHCANVTRMEADVIPESEAAQSKMHECNETKTDHQEEKVSPHLSVPVSENEGVDSKLIGEVKSSKSSNTKSEVHEEMVASCSNVADPEKPLTFNDFNSPEEMEVLGLERLKSELQARGLKCGGTLPERAARPFLLKSTPLDKLPKKLLAKK